MADPEDDGKAEEEAKASDLPSGYLATLTAQQAAVLVRLKALLAESEYADDVASHADEDRWLLRFLRATMAKKSTTRIFQLEAAIARLRETLAWRKQMGLNQPFESVAVPDEYELFQAVRPQHMWVDRKAGTLVMIDQLGLVGSYVKASHLTSQQWEECLAYNAESVAHSLRTEFREEIQGIHAIIDEHGLGFGILKRIGMIKQINHVASTHFPETVGTLVAWNLGVGTRDSIVFLNCPPDPWMVNFPTLARISIIRTGYVFPRLFATFKSFLDADTVSKIHVHKSIPAAEFARIYDVDQLPMTYGGNSEVHVPAPLDAPSKYHAEAAAPSK